MTAAIIDMLFVNSGGRSGLDLLRFIRRHTGVSDLPVIVLTGFALNQTVMAEIEEYGGELWHKPVDPIEIMDRLGRLVGTPLSPVEPRPRDTDRRA